MDNFIVSARKYRPATFRSVVGQEHITSTLKNAIKSGQVAQAFLNAEPEVRRIAAEHSLASADKADSQDFYSGDVNELIGAPPREGEIVDSAGRVLAKHDGFWHFTVGQRKGLGIGGGGTPYYVVAIDACRNRVVVGPAEETFKNGLRVSDVNWVSYAPTDAEIPCMVKVRSAGRLVPAVLRNGRDCEFAEPVAGVAPGQSAVFYDASGAVVCGGIIE